MEKRQSRRLRRMMGNIVEWCNSVSEDLDPDDEGRVEDLIDWESVVNTLKFAYSGIGQALDMARNAERETK
jgi:hypothetical protein